MNSSIDLVQHYAHVELHYTLVHLELFLQCLFGHAETEMERRSDMEEAFDAHYMASSVVWKERK